MKKEQEQYWKTVIHTINLFKRYFANELDSKDREWIENWKPDKDTDSSEKKSISANVVERHGMLVKKKVFNQLGIQNQEEEPSMKRNFFTVPRLVKYASVAAIVSIVIGVSYFMSHPDSLFKENRAFVKNERQLFAQTGDLQTKEVQLPDGSKIHINSNSSIEYLQKEFNKDKREIWLEGEGYFDVAKNPEKPFIIHSKEITTIVHGTSFNIKAYECIGEISVTVETGRVEVRSYQSVIGMLTPNKQLVYKEKNKAHVIADRNWGDAAAWMDKRLVLQDANVNELKIRLKQIYGMDIVVDNDVLTNSILNASYPEGTKINSVLLGISEIYGIKYSIDEKEKIVRLY